jgi:hypothetical protein
MNISFHHFIITRFNLKQSIWEFDKYGGPVNNDSWLKDRFELFERYCFPSIKAQTNQNFTWLVYFDVDTPENFKVKNNQLKNDFTNFTPKYVVNFSAFENELPKHINSHLKDEEAYIITTRLDNDDCFHRNTVDVIQSHFVPEHKTIIDLSNGLYLLMGKTNKLSVKNNVVSGPFISLVERVEKSHEFLTVYDREHLLWINDATYINIRNGYYWLQIIHDRNLSNNLRGNITFNKKLLKGYDFLEPISFSIKYYIFIILKKIKLIKTIKYLKPS